MVIVVSPYFDLLLCERRPLRSRIFLNLLKDNHFCFLRCELLLNFEHPIRLTEHYPAPRLNVRVFSYRKETPTSRLKRGWQGINFLISPVFGNLKQCLYIINRDLLESTPFEIIGIMCSSFSLQSHHALSLRVWYHKQIRTY